jgi:hypothetical protein
MRGLPEASVAQGASKATLRDGGFAWSVAAWHTRGTEHRLQADALHAAPQAAKQGDLIGEPVAQDALDPPRGQVEEGGHEWRAPSEALEADQHEGSEPGGQQEQNPAYGSLSMTIAILHS